MASKIKTGDKVVLIVGSKEYRNKTYTVTSMLSKTNFRGVENEYVILAGYKTLKRAQKITEKNQENFKTVDIPVHISNVMLANSANKPERVGFKIELADGVMKKSRILKKSGIDVVENNRFKKSN